MTFGIVLDVVIGLSVIYLSASLFVTIINEYINQFLNLRAKQLVSDLGQLINDPSVVAKIAQNPALASFFGPPTKASSFVDTKVLAQQIIGGLRVAGAAPATLSNVIASINSLPPSTLKDQLLALAQSTEESVDELVKSVSEWVDRSLTMMGEAYKQRMQVISFAVGLIIAVAFNFDTLNIVKRLYYDQASREAMAAYGTSLVDKISEDKLKQCLENRGNRNEKNTAQHASEATIDSDQECAILDGVTAGLQNGKTAMTTLPIGHLTFPTGVLGWLSAVAGWFLTALATALGAPFWFGLLNRVANIRHSMPKPSTDDAE